MTIKHHVSLLIASEGEDGGKPWTEDGGIVGLAADEAEAVRVAKAAGYSVIPADNGGLLDFYDAEDGPGMGGYEPDGRGCWIVTVDPLTTADINTKPKDTDMTINLDAATTADLLRAIFASDSGEVAVESHKGGYDRGIAFVVESDEGGIWVRWESGVTTPALLDA